MRLHNLHSTLAKDFVMFEELSPDQEEKLSYVQMMLARQGKDPDPVIRRIRGLVDPKFAKKEGAKATLKNWLKDAKRGETKDGATYGRRIRITVLESEIRELVLEGFFKDVGSLVVRKLRSVISGERKEHELVSKALDTYPNLAALVRYAGRSVEPIYDDQKFWQLVDKMTNNKANTIKRIAHSTYERLSNESIEGKKGVLTECIIVEAKISQVLNSLGLDQNQIDGLMRQYAIRDEDYDLSRIKSAYQTVKEYPGKIAAKGAETLKSIRDYPGKTAAAKVKESPGNVKEENLDFVEEVVKVAYAMMELEKANAETPKEVAQVLDKVIEPEYEVVKDVGRFKPEREVAGSVEKI